MLYAICYNKYKKTDYRTKYCNMRARKNIKDLRAEPEPSR
jgi:hypothetical protein